MPSRASSAGVAVAVSELCVGDGADGGSCQERIPGCSQGRMGAGVMSCQRGSVMSLI